ncbi:MAG: transcription antitermination factor NusB [Deltaproteobacteria bacterium]|nr:transcription antitermination factor NusB [Deltaproteobacteria bacterium]
MGMRRRSRELALQVLFHLEYNPAGPEEAFDRVCGNFDVSPDSVPFARSLVTGVLEKTEEVHGAIVAASENWRLERMSRVDRCILRMAVLEMLFMEDIPPKVSIDEAVELGKRFGSEDSARFINGVLDHILTGGMVKDAGASETENPD